MTEYKATVKWQRNGDDVLANKYSRAHVWLFDGGAEVAASASPHIVPRPWSVEENVDPEEAFVASLSSCHMLLFLAIVTKNGFQIESYVDHALGQMAKNQQGRIAITRVELRPQTEFSGVALPDAETLAGFHHRAHAECFIANSVHTQVDIILDPALEPSRAEPS